MAIKNNKQTNPLLVKSVVGKAKQSVYDLPAEDHVYGKLVPRDPMEDASLVLQQGQMKGKRNKKDSYPEPAPGLDYIRMNKESAKLGIVGCASIKKYRKEHPAHLKEPSTAISTKFIGGEIRKSGKLPSDKNPYYTYGKPTLVSTPVAMIMSSPPVQEVVNPPIAQKNSKPKYTKYIEKRKVKVQKDVKELFKLSRFKKVPAMVDLGKKPKV